MTTLKHTLVTLVRREGAYLSIRQFAVFLTCYLMDGGYAVCGLAAELKVSKPAVTRALDRRGELDLAKRKADRADRRSVLVPCTVKGAAFLRDLRAALSDAAAAAQKAIPRHLKLVAAPAADTVAAPQKVSPQWGGLQPGTGAS